MGYRHFDGAYDTIPSDGARSPSLGASDGPEPMYDLPYHKAGNENEADRFIRDNPFALLVGSAHGKPVATQVPLLLEKKRKNKWLRGHMMRGTDHHKALEENSETLVVFTGAHVYVSGSWYSNPHTPSTWNYMSVHARGTIRFLDDAGLLDVLRTTSLYFEEANESPTIYDNLAPELTRTLTKLIVGFEIEVTSLDSVFKLSQDRDLESYRSIIAELMDQGEDARTIAAEMEKRARQVFPDDVT